MKMEVSGVWMLSQDGELIGRGTKDLQMHCVESVVILLYSRKRVVRLTLNGNQKRL